MDHFNRASYGRDTGEGVRERRRLAGLTVGGWRHARIEIALRAARWEKGRRREWKPGFEFGAGRVRELGLA